MAFCLSDCAVTATFKKFFPEAKRAWSVASDHTTLREQTLVKKHLASSPGLWYYAAIVPSRKAEAPEKKPRRRQEKWERRKLALILWK